MAPEPKPSRGVRAEISRRVLNFTPSWFSVNMGTGITSILIKNLPYQFSHQYIIADTIFVLNVLLFVIFLVITIARYIIWPHVFPLMLHHPVQSLFLGTFPMGLNTIGNMVVFVCVPSFGQRFVVLAWVIWWITVVLSVVIGTGMPFVVHTRHKTSFDQISGVWFLPIVTSVVTAASGGVVATVLSPANARITLTVSYILWGLGVPFSFFLMPLYYARLAIHKLPPPAIIVSVFLPIGPCGQGAYGIMQLAKVVRHLSQIDQLVEGDQYTTDEIRVFASAIYGTSIVVALVMWGVGLFWVINALLTIADKGRQGQIPFNMGWWGFTFPLGVYAVATTTLGAELDSEAFRILGTIFSLAVVLLWAFVSIRTAIEAWEGAIFHAPCLAGLDHTTGHPPEATKPADPSLYLG